MSDSLSSQDCLSEDELLRLLEARGAAMGSGRCEQHLTVCKNCRDRLESLAGGIPRQLAESTNVTDSEALTQAIADLCSSRPQWDSKAIFRFLRPSTDPDNLGSLGKYEIREIIGQGGMGVVFGAIDPILQREVAIKVPTPSLVATHEAHDRFLRESRAIASVRHDNIVCVFAVEEVDDTLFMVMERIDGKSLEHEIREQQQLPFEEVVRIATEACAALEAAHASGLVHRDIKPANILLEAPSRRVKITDFGLAKSATDVSLTASGMVTGTPEYMAPEQATEAEVTARSDLFSLGVVIYAALTGHSPFRGKNALLTLQRLCTEIPRSVAASNSTVPAWFDELLQQMLAKDALQRPQSATEVLKVLRKRSPIRSATGNVGTREPLRRRPVWPKIGLAVLAAGMTALASYLWPRADATPEKGMTERRTLSDKRGFVMQGRHFADLAQAISSAPDGEIIEVVGDGPFEIAGFDLGDKGIKILAADGSRPVFSQGGPDAAREAPFLRTDGNLVLQGLEIHWQIHYEPSSSISSAAELCVVSIKGDLKISECRLVAASMTGCVGVSDGSVDIDSSHLIAEKGPCVAWNASRNTQATLRNSVFEGDIGLMCKTTRNLSQDQNASIELRNNTFLTSRGIQLVRPQTHVKMVVIRNVFDVSDVLVLVGSRPKMMQITSQADVLRLLKTYVDWSESENAFGRSANLFSRSMTGMNQPTRSEVDSLSDWQSIWGADSGSVEADFEYKRVEDGLTSQRQLVRIRKNSTEAVEGIGADIETVGP